MRLGAPGRTGNFSRADQITEPMLPIRMLELLGCQMTQRKEDARGFALLFQRCKSRCHQRYWSVDAVGKAVEREVLAAELTWPGKDDLANLWPEPCDWSET